MAGLFDDDPAPRPGGSLFGDVQAALPEPTQTPSYRVLARKYRPVLFDDLIGQDSETTRGRGRLYRYLAR